MPSNKAFNRRIQILDRCLRRRQRVWTVNSLLDATNEHLASNGCPEVSIRTLYDDLRYLQDTLNAPVEKYQQGKKTCYRYLSPDFTLVNSPLSSEEKDILQKMLAYLRARNLPLQTELADLLDRHGILANTSLTDEEELKIPKPAAPQKKSETPAATKNLASRSATELKLKMRERADNESLQESAALPEGTAQETAGSFSQTTAEEILINKLILRMELDDLAPYRDSFWNWLESEQ